MSIFDSFKNRREIKKAKADIDKAKDNICSPKMIDFCISFADDFIILLKRLNLWEDKDKYAEFSSYMEIVDFSISIVIAAFHGDNRSLPKIYPDLLSKYSKYIGKNIFIHDERILAFISNMYAFIQSCGIKVWGEITDDMILYHSDIIQRFGEYSKNLQKDDSLGDLKYKNTLSNLVENYTYRGFSNKLSEIDKTKLIAQLHSLFLPFYQRCAEIFYPIDAMLKLYPLM